MTCDIKTSSISLYEADLTAEKTLGTRTDKFQTTYVQSFWSKVHTHTEHEELYLMLRSNSCQVEMALGNHGDI